jgi:DNA polymerase/3'-5' exonuclease PolX
MRLRASGDGIEHGNGDLLRANSEEEIFGLLGLPYVLPEERS